MAAPAPRSGSATRPGADAGFDERLPRAVCPGVGPGSGQAGGQPRAVDEQLVQVPVVVGEGGGDRAQAGDVAVQPFGGAVDVGVDELTEGVEVVLVAPGQVPPVERRGVVPTPVHDDTVPGRRTAAVRIHARLERLCHRFMRA